MGSRTSAILFAVGILLAAIAVGHVTALVTAAAILFLFSMLVDVASVVAEILALFFQDELEEGE